jgi:hypothetical protein
MAAAPLVLLYPLFLVPAVIDFAVDV